MKKINTIYLAACLMLLVVPLVGMSWYGNVDAIENKELEAFPKLVTEEGINWDYLSAVGNYFEDHFAYRQELITANSALRANVFATGSSQVIVGQDDWLYYMGTLADYQSDDPMTTMEQAVFGHNLSLVQEFVEANGAAFYFTIAPNKNSLYPEQMPWYHQGSDAPANYQLVEEVLAEQQVNYIDLYEAFETAEDVLYFERDSHWNTKGAELANQTILEALGLDYETYDGVGEEIQNVHEGDIDSMLYPYNTSLEEDVLYPRAEGYTLVNEITDYMDSVIETVNPTGEGSLLLYRDSFGESLVPFLAEEVATGYFSMNTPYYIEEMKYRKPDYVVIEIVERNLRNLVARAPILEPVPVAPMIGEAMESTTTMTVEKQGSFFVIEGQVEETLATDATTLYLNVKATEDAWTTYPLFLTVNNGVLGYKVYLNEDKLTQGATIELLYQDQGVYCITSMQYEE